VLRRLFGKLRTLFPRAWLRVRADAGFADAKLLTFLETAGVEYVLGLAGNPRLDKRVRRLLGRARMQARTTGATATLYGETRYAARRWDRKRRIIMKAEVPFEACSNFTRVAARRLADPPMVGRCPESFSRSVTLLAASVATGVHRQLPRRDLHPQDSRHLFTARRIVRAKGS
jgi:hypothetical protein